MVRNCFRKNDSLLRQLLAYFLWLSPLLAYPLVWLRPFYGKVPLWGDVQFISSHVTGLIAVAIVLLYPERVKKLFTKSPARYWMISSAAAAIIAMANYIIFPGSPMVLATVLQTLCLPLAGAALAPQIRRAALPCGAVCAVVLIVFTATGDRFLTGFTGNWNWNMTMICATLPALTVILFPKKHPFIIAGIISSMFLAAVFFFIPEIAPRGTVAAMILASLCAPVIRKINRERRSTALVGIALAIGFLFFSTINAPIAEKVNDSRFQLWKSSLNMVKEHIFTGCGPGRFEQAVRSYMTKEYFFTDFSATRHPHPHNELLLYISEFGIAGAAVFILFCGSALNKSSHRKDRPSRWMAWMFLFLALHGQVDVLLSTPLAGCWFLLSGGALAARGAGKSQVKAPHLRTILAAASALGAVIFAVSIFSATSHLREAKLSLLKNDTMTAKKHLDISLEKLALPEARYITAQIQLFNLKDPAGAVIQLFKLESDVCGGYLHSYGLTARALTALGKFAEAKEFFALERQAYPYSVLYAGFELAALELSHASAAERAEAKARLIRNLELRDIPLSEVNRFHRDAALDDAPIPWGKLK